MKAGLFESFKLIVKIVSDCKVVAGEICITAQYCDKEDKKFLGVA
jgi:hypothetical protein